MSRPLRLAYLADPNSVHTRRWLGFFADRGHDVTLLVGSEDVIQPGLHAAIRPHPYRRFGRRRLPFVSSLQGRRRLRAALATVRPEILHAHYLTRHGWQARLSGFHPSVVTPWGSDLFVTPRESRRARLWAGLTLRDADLVTVVSDHMQSEVVRYGTPVDRIARIMFGVDTDRFAPAADVSPPPALVGRPFILAPRAIRPLYRPDVVIDAVAELPPTVDLVMTTRNAEPTTLDDVRRRIARHALGDRVRLLDAIDDDLMLDLVRTAALVVSVPESDAIPISILEAMACGRPVVATDLPGPRERLGSISPQLLVPVGDAAETARAMRSVLEMPASALASLGALLRADAVANADLQRNMERMEQLYLMLRARTR